MGAGVVLLELLKLYNPSFSAGAGAPEAALLELLKLYNSSSSAGADALGAGATGADQKGRRSEQSPA